MGGSPGAALISVSWRGGAKRGAAALMESLIRNHPFVCYGNKRTAITAAGIFLHRNGHLLETSQTELYRFTMAMATGGAKFKDAHSGCASIRALRNGRFPEITIQAP